MQLTRRDALAALAAVGAVGGGAAFADRYGERVDPPSADPSYLQTVVALAEVLYPAETTGVQSFVETYVQGRLEGRDAYRTGVAEAAEQLDDSAREWHGEAFVETDLGVRNELLLELGVDTADPDPDGTTPERIRYYLVNDLLFAFYTSPTGGELVGIENPQGHPGGTASYQRGPDE